MIYCILVLHPVKVISPTRLPVKCVDPNNTGPPYFSRCEDNHVCIKFHILVIKCEMYLCSVFESHFFLVFF